MDFNSGVSTMPLFFWGLIVAAAQAAGPIEFRLPLDCTLGENCEIMDYMDHAGKDYLCGTRTKPKHDGTDFRIQDYKAMNAGVKVVAAAAGKVIRVRNTMHDVTVKVIGDAAIAGSECGNGLGIDHGNGWKTQYCHMKENSIFVKSGESVIAGQALGMVGLSGSTEFPHLHFTVWFEGKAVDPFAFGTPSNACTPGVQLWKPMIPYKSRAIMGFGFTDGKYSLEDIDENRLPPVRANSFLVPYIRFIGLKAGDRIRLSLIGPNGLIIKNVSKPLAENQVLSASFFEVAPPAEGWKGNFHAHFEVIEKNDQVVLEQHSYLNL